MATQSQIITDINTYMTGFGKSNSAWYVGIAADARHRLFSAHSVDEKNGAWIFRQADSHTIARSTEKAYHDAGFSGGPGGGDNSTVYVYAYLITSTTKE
jgi:hypothetical protein